MKKRLLSLVMALCVIFSFAISVKAASAEAQETYIATSSNLEEIKKPVAVATVTNSETGVVQEIEIEPVFVGARTCANGDQVVDVGYSAYVPIALSNSRAITNKTTTDAGVTATVQVQYTLSSTKEQISITKLYGGWTPSSPLYILSKRRTGVSNEGVLPASSMVRYPTSNTFSYPVSWGYENFVTGSEYSPTAWSEATIQVSGMSGQHFIEVEFSFPDGRG